MWTVLLGKGQGTELRGLKEDASKDIMEGTGIRYKGTTPLDDRDEMRAPALCVKTGEHC